MLQGLLLAAGLLLALPCSFAQKAISGKLSYSAFIAEVDRLNHDIVRPEYRLAEIQSIFPSGEYSLRGWIVAESADSVRLLDFYGSENRLAKAAIIRITAIPADSTAIDPPGRQRDFHFISEPGSRSISYCRMALWLDKRGHKDVAASYWKKLQRWAPGRKALRDAFGFHYFDKMLQCYTHWRDYAEAIRYGSYFLEKELAGYQYASLAAVLSKQLAQRPGDFSSFRLPSPGEWQGLRKSLSRQQQFHYLIERLHLINCVQPGQPAGISYAMPQYARPYASYDGTCSWTYESDTLGPCTVINPCIEILQLNPEIDEVRYLIPYLRDSSYIPTYTYWRNFFAERTLHRFRWTVGSLIFSITRKNFVNYRDFDRFSADRQEAVIQKMLHWCEENKALGKEAYLATILRQTENWHEFQQIIPIAVARKYAALIDIIGDRFYDFERPGWLSQRGEIAQTIFEYGSDRDSDKVRKWANGAEDERVILWTSLYQLKHDSQNHEKAFAALSSLLENNCDGTSFYPHAMKTLLQLKDRRALPLAEGILDKPRFRDSWRQNYNHDLVRQLVVAGSKPAFDFLYRGLTDTAVKAPASAEVGTNSISRFADLPCDDYIWVVEDWRSRQGGYDYHWGLEKRRAYSLELAAWLSRQVNSIRQGEPHQMLPPLKAAEAPVEFIDPPGW